MTLIFEKVTRDAVDLVTAIMVSFTTYFSQPDIIRTRLTYNCAHLRSTKESLTDSVKNLFVRKKILCENFLGQNLLGEHFFFCEIFWVKIFLSKNFG